MDPHGHDEIDAVVYTVTREFDGAISAEHGIGTKKQDYLPQCRSASDIGAMRAIRQALDPHRILNPGKVV